MMLRPFLRQAAISLVVSLLFGAAVVAVPEESVVLIAVYMVFVIMAMTLDLSIGDAGLLNMGHMAFFGGGAYASTLLHQRWGWPLPLAIVGTLVLVGIVAFLIGLPAASRTTGLYFAIVTFAFGMLLVELVNNTTDISGGSEGLPVDWGLGEDLPFDWSLYRYFAVWVVAVLLVTMVAVAAIRHSQFGLRLRAIRESEDLTRGLGFNPTLYKTAITVAAAVIVSLAGCMYAPMVGFINPHIMGIDQLIVVLGLVAVGGVRSMLGAFVGVALLYTLPQWLEVDPTLRPLFVGVAMVVVILLSPKKGIAGNVADLGRFLVSVARRRGRTTPTTDERGPSISGVVPADPGSSAGDPRHDGALL